ncbi:MAG: translocation/assembly module TamB domain-containing protein, partial [Flavobacterium sp.]
MEAIYTVSGGSNPALLVENSSVNKKIPTDVSIKITGSLTSPEPDFNITFPRSPQTQSEVQAKLADKDMRQTQALALLATGSFISSEGASQQTAVKQSAYEAAGSIFDNLFQSNEEKVKVNVNLVPADYTPGKETQGNVGFTVSTQINDRVKLNGQLGVPTGGLNQSTFVGNVKVEYRVNEDGTLNLRFFNRENDINYIGQGTGFNYTQGVGVTYEVDFNTFNELMDRIFRNQQVKLQKLKAEQIQDSEAPEGLNFKDESKKKNNKKKPKPNQNREAIPTKEDDPGF